MYAEFASQSSLEALHRGLKDQRVMLELLDEKDRLLTHIPGNPENNVWSNQGPRSRRRNITRTITGADSKHAQRPATVSHKVIG